MIIEFTDGRGLLVRMRISIIGVASYCACAMDEKHTWYVFGWNNNVNVLFVWMCSELKVPFENEEEAEVVYNSLRVDPEPPRSGVTKHLQRNKNLLIV